MGGDRAIGRLVSLNGAEGMIACELSPSEIGDHWSVGHLISIVHQQARLVGVVCELSTADRRWNESDANVAYVKVELSGEIVDDDDGAPRFFRGIRSYPRSAPSPIASAPTTSRRSTPFAASTAS